ncbi:hypothetical protein [Candidatus Palauibacter sp.]|uniref:hypothetical protein n=1 Tax=Candidatus Palauibacter sp. TaxID=3101350 RepID=UPI003CC6ABAE
MPLIPYPQAAAFQTEVELNHAPSDVALVSPFSDEVHAVRYGPGSWSGRIQIVRTEAHGFDDVGAEITVQAGLIEAWIAAMDGPAAVSEIPIHRPVPTVPDGTTVGSHTTSDDIVTTVISAAIAGVRAGHYLRIGRRLYLVRSAATGTQLVLHPQFSGNVGAVVTAGTTVRAARRTGSVVSSVWTSEFAGPWAVPIIERP